MQHDEHPGLFCILVLSACLLASCGGGSDEHQVTSHSVTLNWTANRERGVNSEGGGYQVYISGKPAINLPYVSGAGAPTSTTVMLDTGAYTVTIRAYAALDALGGKTGALSDASSPITVIVP